jgi:hypothetical protein
MDSLSNFEDGIDPLHLMIGDTVAVDTVQVYSDSRIAFSKRAVANRGGFSTRDGAPLGI